MDSIAKYLSETCSDPIEYLRQLRQTTEPIGGGIEYREDGELVEYDVAIEAIKKATDVFIGKAVEWLRCHPSSYYDDLEEFSNAFRKYMEEE